MIEDSLLGEDGPKHDLSAWRITIPTIATRPEMDNPRKNFYTFVIDVRRLDVTDGTYLKSVNVISQYRDQPSFSCFFLIRHRY